MTNGESSLNAEQEQTNLTAGILILKRQVSVSDQAAFMSCPTFGTPSHVTVKPTEPTG